MASKPEQIGCESQRNPKYERQCTFKQVVFIFHGVIIIVDMPPWQRIVYP